MGYYTGAGVTSGGGSTVGVFEHFVWFGAHNVYQKTTSVTTRKSGVSLNVAKSVDSECNMSMNRFTWGNGCFHYSMNCRGSQRQVHYSQMGDSNLYEMTIEDQRIKAKLDDGGWVS